jgi:hypothetical protein
MRRALSLGLLMAVCGCGMSQYRAGDVQRAEAPSEAELFGKLAKEIDPGPQTAVWPRIAAALRGEAELSAPRDKAPEARLDAARRRLGGWSVQVSTTEPDELGAKLKSALEGIYLVEPLALSSEPSAASLEARALLWEFYGAFVHTHALVKSFETLLAKSSAGKLADVLATSELLAKVAPAMRDRFAADVLRARAPARTVDEILRAHAARKLDAGDLQEARALYTEYLRRNQAAATGEDWLRVAFTHVRLEDERAAVAALARARFLAPAGDRKLQASFRSADRDLDALKRLLALPPGKDAASLLARFDLLYEMDRIKEAESVHGELARKRPDDARVRVRGVQLRVRRGEIDASLVKDLPDVGLTDKDAAFWSMRIGALGVALVKAAPNPRELDDLRAATAELAKLDPGRAAALAFVLERTARMLSGPVDGKALLDAMQGSMDDALALRAKYPGTSDVDRIVIALALFRPDPRAGLATTLVRPRTPPEDDAELYLQRARTAVALAAFVGHGADLGGVRRAIEDIPPTSDSETEALREVLFADADVLAGLDGGGAAAWTAAVQRYQTARKTIRGERARIDNNIGYAMERGGDSARATAFFDASSRGQTARRWVPLLNLATAPSEARTATLERVRALAGPADAEPPALVSAWLAAVETDAGGASAAAARALGELDAPMALHKASLHARGLETEGSFALGLGLRSGLRAHTMNASAHASLWLVRPMPITRAALEEKVRSPGGSRAR